LTALVPALKLPDMDIFMTKIKKKGMDILYIHSLFLFFNFILTHYILLVCDYCFFALRPFYHSRIEHADVIMGAVLIRLSPKTDGLSAICEGFHRGLHPVDIKF